MMEGSRAPWAKAPGTGPAPAALNQHIISGAAPGAGASITRAPWATAAPGGADPAGAAGTRAQWAQGVSISNAGGMEVVNFGDLAKLNPEYAASLSAAAAAASSSAAAAAADSSAAAAAGSSSSAAAPAAAASSASASPSAVPQIYSAPCKLIKTPAYLPLWKETAAYAELTSFILVCNERIRGVKVKPAGQPSRKYSISPPVARMVSWLVECKALIASVPPIQQSMRFGNKAFRTWHERVTTREALTPLLSELLGPALVAQGAISELVPYIADSFGSTQRIDYGTGHELNFVLVLVALTKLGVFGASDYIALVLEVFRSYIDCMQELQSVYWLEPAGSKGAWGLDDFQFLPFLWGSSQLNGSTIAPADLLRSEVVDARGDEYLFLKCIGFIARMKKGPFHEHSSFLHHISTLPSWAKANSGLCKMYEAEVLAKFPIVQHILFGRMLRFERRTDAHTRAVQEAMEEATQRRHTQEQEASNASQREDGTSGVAGADASSRGADAEAEASAPPASPPQ